MSGLRKLVCAPLKFLRSILDWGLEALKAVAEVASDIVISGLEKLADFAKGGLTNLLLLGGLALGGYFLLTRDKSDKKEASYVSAPSNVAALPEPEKAEQAAVEPQSKDDGDTAGRKAVEAL